MAVLSGQLDEIEQQFDEVPRRLDQPCRPSDRQGWPNPTSQL
jgi:hypothetical protein